ncbi:MAG: hypothetical protein HC831_19640 [Chloroflexia bacterium]|nr:hypothetical protein [Chloroflexia bacterium]
MRLFFFTVLFLFSCQFLIAQNEGFDQEKLSKIKNYRSTRLENGLTVLCLTTQDTSKFFIRSYTDLPGYVDKSYQELLSVDTEIRKFNDFKVPSPWSNESLNSLKINLNKDVNGYYASCPPESLDTAMYLFSDLFQKPIIEPAKIELAKRNVLSRSDSLLKITHGQDR